MHLLWRSKQRYFSPMLCHLRFPALMCSPLFPAITLCDTRVFPPSFNARVALRWNSFLCVKMNFQFWYFLALIMSYFFIALQASALEERLRETEVKLKQNQEEAQTNIQRLNESNSQLVSFWVFESLQHYLSLSSLNIHQIHSRLQSTACIAGGSVLAIGPWLTTWCLHNFLVGFDINFTPSECF